MAFKAEPDLRHMVPLITNKRQHEAATAAVERLMLKPKRSELDNARLEAMSLLIEAYEKRVFARRFADPIELVKYQMEQMGLNANQLANELEIGRGRMSELLNRKRGLSLEMIRLISERLGIPVEQLVGKTSKAIAAGNPKPLTKNAF
jgi:HTH-type transcriptional regulator / antitoxin HigA